MISEMGLVVGSETVKYVHGADLLSSSCSTLELEDALLSSATPISFVSVTLTSDLGQTLVMIDSVFSFSDDVFTTIITAFNWHFDHCVAALVARKNVWVFRVGRDSLGCFTGGAFVLRDLLDLLSQRTVVLSATAFVFKIKRDYHLRGVARLLCGCHANMATLFALIMGS